MYKILSKGEYCEQSVSVLSDAIFDSIDSVECTVFVVCALIRQSDMFVSHNSTEGAGKQRVYPTPV
jgi:hypothetical protein